MSGSTPPSPPTSPPQPRHPIRPSLGTSIRRKIIKWLFFNILFALIPLIYRYLNLCLFRSCDNPLDLLYKKGELLLLSTVIFAESIGELTNTELHYKQLALIIMGFSFLLLMLNTNMLADLEEYSNGSAVAWWSCSTYVTSIIIGISSKILGKD